MTLVWIDTETGGLDPSVHSLLTLAMVVQSTPGNQEVLHLGFQHSSYVVDAEAMAVNKLDLVRHHASARPPDLAVALIEAFLDRQAPHGQVMLAGHNVGFDIAFLMRYLRLHGPHLVSRFSHRIVDTMSLATALQVAGILPKKPVGLTALLDHYGIELPPQLRHTALGDAQATADLFQAMVATLAPAAP
jgi:DNA polymerase-3 subunit epsilon